MITDFGSLIALFINLLLSAIPLVGSLAFLVFLWGLVKFIARVGGDEKAIDEGKNLMKWGVLALFIMISVWGIIRFFQDSLGLSGGGLGIPQLPT